MTLKIRSRSPKPKHLFIMSRCYSLANLVKIWQPVHEILCKQSVTPTRTLKPTGSAPKTICPPPLWWEDIIQAIPNICSKLHIPKCSSSWEMLDTSFPMYYIGVRDIMANINLGILVFFPTIYRRLPLCRLRVSRYYHLCRSDFSFPTFFVYISLHVYFYVENG